MPFQEPHVNKPHSAAARSLAKGVRTISRSFRFHRPRGAFCHRGWCQQCKVLDASGKVVLACEQPPDSECRPLPHRIPGRAAGALAERLVPWFWERIAYRRGPLRQIFLAIIRRLTSAPDLPPALDGLVPLPPNLERSCDTLVIGGGLSGLVAAATLARAGRRTLLVSASRFGTEASLRALAPAEAERWIDDTHKLVEVHEEQLCIGLYEDGSQARCTGRHTNLSIQFETLVVATGAYDRLPIVPGNDLPGIIGIRALEALAGIGSLSAGLQIGVYGNPDELRRAVSAARSAGVTPAFVAGPDGCPGLSLPVIIGRLQAIRGDRHGVRSVMFQDGTERACDLLVSCLSQPTYELQAQRGARVALRGHDATLCTMGADGKGLLVVGEAAGWFDRTDSVARTQSAITNWLQSGTAPEPAAWVRQEAPVPSPLPDEAFVCLCEDVRAKDIRQAIADGYADVELIKRHTGAGTGPCQGKLCHGAILHCAATAGLKVDVPTMRPLVRPVMMSQLMIPADET